MTKSTLINDLLKFIELGKTPYHVVAEIVKRLDKAKFIALREDQPWKLEPENGYYLVRGGSIIGFYYPKPIKNNPVTPYRIWAAHTDSPALKLKGHSYQKYQPESQKDYQVWGVEIYGSPILNTWLDRPLDISGRVFINQANKKDPQIKLWKSQAKAVIPNAAIHLNREVNKSFALNRETQLQVLITQSNQTLEQEIARDLKVKTKDILALDLFLNDTQPPELLGSLIQSPKLDNLAMCHAGLTALLNYDTSKKPTPFPILALFNNEEVGSRSSEGAASNLLAQTFNRINQTLKYNFEEIAIRQAISTIISADMAHAYHPGFDELYGKNHRSYLDRGIVLKRDSNLHYINDGELLVKAKQWLQNNKLDYQEYFQHNNIPCGTTIGPHLSSQMGIKTLDLGTPILAMHSLRETGSVQDHQTITKFAELFFNQD